MNKKQELFELAEKLRKHGLNRLHLIIIKDTVEGDGRLADRLHKAASFLDENGHSEASQFLLFGCGYAFNTLSTRIEKEKKNAEANN